MCSSLFAPVTGLLEANVGGDVLYLPFHTLHFKILLVGCPIIPSISFHVLIVAAFHALSLMFRIVSPLFLTSHQVFMLPIGKFVIRRDKLKTCAFRHMSFIDGSKSWLALEHTLFAGDSLSVRCIAAVLALLAIDAAPALAAPVPTGQGTARPRVLAAT